MQKLLFNNVVLNSSKDNYFCPYIKEILVTSFKTPDYFLHLNVKKNLTYGGFLFAEKKNFSKDDIINLLKLGELINRYPYNLSGGEKQR